MPITPFHPTVCRCLLLIAALVAMAAIGLHPPAVAAQSTTTTTEPRAIPEALNFANGLYKERLYARAAEEYERFLKDTA
ncbi:MAG TPA: hypothetical protein VGZ22_29380, partial [Isosphaeraceae bacterium]|nr:hypothetical protein [Isosphaeraceae bacterium]